MNPHMCMFNWFALVHPARACSTFSPPAQKYNSAARKITSAIDFPPPPLVSMKALKTNPQLVITFSVLEQSTEVA